MATSKQQEEKRIQFLRRMVALPHNRNCFDCGQRGPTYVNMTIGSYVCTACSGILRGLNPPCRVKSISMASFTQDEVDMLTVRGNEYNRQVWLGLHDTKQPPSIDTKDEIKLRDYLTQKYERKRWYLAPSDGLAENAKIMNFHNMNESSTRRAAVGAFKMPAPPLSKLPVVTSTNISKVQAPVQMALVNEPPKPTTQPTVAATNSSADLVDVFGASSGQADSDFSQPNFANFSGMTATGPAPDDNILDIPSIEPSEVTGTQTANAATSSASQWSTLTTDASSIATGDKYASLSGLFSNQPEPVNQTPAVQPSGGGVNWNSINWSSAPSATADQGGVSWGSSSTSQTPTNNMFNQQAGPINAASGWGNPPPSNTGVNPFLVSNTMAAPQNANSFGMAAPQPAFTQPSASFGAFSAQASAPTQPNTGAPFQQPQTMATNPFGAPAMGGFNSLQNQPTVNGANGSLYGGTASTFPNGNTGAQWGMSQPNMNQWGGSVPSANQWSMPASKPATSVNPFMTPAQPGLVNQQPATNNPFL